MLHPPEVIAVMLHPPEVIAVMLHPSEVTAVLLHPSLMIQTVRYNPIPCTLSLKFNTKKNSSCS